MKNMLLMRYRAIAASLYEYIRTSGIMYGKYFSRANGHIRPAENGKGTSIVKVHQIANVMSESIDERLLYFVINLSKVDEAVGQMQCVEDLILQSLTKSITLASGNSDDISFGRGAYLRESDDRGLAQVQYVEDLILQSLIRSITLALGNSDNILFGESNNSTESDDKGLPQVQYVEDLILQSLTESITRGSGHSYDILFGQSIASMETNDEGNGRVANAERGIGRSIAELLHKAALTSDGVGFGRGLDLTKSVDTARMRIAIAERTIGQDFINILHKASWSYDIEFSSGFDSTEVSAELRLGISDIMYSAGTEIYKLLRLIASPDDSNLLNGRGLMSAKLVGNSNISLEVPVETTMICVKTLDNHTVSGVTEKIEPVLNKSVVKSFLNAGGEIVEYGDADHWNEPVKIGTTLYIRSVYEYEKADSSIYIQ